MFFLFIYLFSLLLAFVSKYYFILIVIFPCVVMYKHENILFSFFSNLFYVENPFSFTWALKLYT